MLDDWDNKCILLGIQSWVLQYNSNSDKKKRYAAKLDNNNHENELYNRMSEDEGNNTGLLSSCLYINFDNT